MPRFFVDKSAVCGGEVIISGDDARHIARSLRMAVGECVTVCDGEGSEYSCRLDSIHDDRVTGTVLSSSRSAAEPPYRLAVFQALVKGDRMDTALQKSVESGVTDFVPFESGRSIVKIKEGSDSRDQRRRRIATEAAMQCGRGALPRVSQPVRFDEMLSKAKEYELALFCYEDEKTRLLGKALPDALPASIAVVIGPEGGFSPEEAARAEEAGLVPVSLGTRILRTESAAAFALAAISFKYELQ